MDEALHRALDVLGAPGFARSYSALRRSGAPPPRRPAGGADGAAAGALFTSHLRWRTFRAFAGAFARDPAAGASLAAPALGATPAGRDGRALAQALVLEAAVATATLRPGEPCPPAGASAAARYESRAAALVGALEAVAAGDDGSPLAGMRIGDSRTSGTGDPRGAVASAGAEAGEPKNAGAGAVLAWAATAPAPELAPAAYAAARAAREAREEAARAPPEGNFTALYRCLNPACGARKAIVTEAHTRAGDEAKTVLVECVVCGQKRRG